jgi:hypothetical protein
VTVETKAAQKSKTRSRNQDRAAMKSEEMKQDTGLVSRFFTGQEKNEKQARSLVRENRRLSSKHMSEHAG